MCDFPSRIGTQLPKPPPESGFGARAIPLMLPFARPPAGSAREPRPKTRTGRPRAAGRYVFGTAPSGAGLDYGVLVVDDVVAGVVLVIATWSSGIFISTRNGDSSISWSTVPLATNWPSICSV